MNQIARIGSFLAISKGPGKMAASLGSGGFTQSRAIECEERKGTLYQLEQDPEERNDVYGQYTDVVAELIEWLNPYTAGGRNTGKDRWTVSFCPDPLLPR